MIDCLYPGNGVHQSGIMVMDMLYKFRFGIRRTCDEHRPRIADSLDNAVKKILIL